MADFYQLTPEIMINVEQIVQIHVAPDEHPAHLPADPNVERKPPIDETGAAMVTIHMAGGNQSIGTVHRITGDAAAPLLSRVGFKKEHEKNRPRK